MTRFNFVACLVGDAESVRYCFETIAPSANFGPSTSPRPARGALVTATTTASAPAASAAAAAHTAPPTSLADASVDVVVNAPSGDVIVATFAGAAALHMCDAVVVVCNSGSARSVHAAHELVGRGGDDAPALPPRAPIVLLDFGAYDADKHALFADMAADLEAVVRYVGSAYLDAEVAGQPERAFASLVRITANAVRCPRHVLWAGQALVEVGRQALRRSFWLLDEDGDGLLDDAEISKWHRTMYGTFSTDDVNTMKAYARNTEASYIAAGTTHARNRLITEDDRVTVLGFLAVCHIMLAEGRHEPLWVMLSAHGVGPDALPYTVDEIERGTALGSGASPASDDDGDRTMLHLSSAGTSFFASLYSRQRFTHPSDLFLFTPDCPWANIYGLPHAGEVDLPVHDFISCWRFMAAVDPPVVARFARYWAFAGDIASLFVACRTRPFRRPGEVPPTALWLVLGSPQCGKTSLMQRIADNDSGTVFADDAHPSGRSAATATVRARINNDGDVLIALRELDEAEVDGMLADARFMNTVAGVLVCFDASEAYSLSYLSRVYPRLAECPDLPVVLAMCKADLPVVDQLGIAEGPREFCAQRGIMWPPVFTSLSHLRVLPGELLNDIDNLTFVLAEVAVNPGLVRDATAFGGGGAGSGGGGGGGGDDGAVGAVGLLRATKRALVVALLAVAAFKLGTGLLRRVAGRDGLAARAGSLVSAAAGAISLATSFWASESGDGDGNSGAATSRIDHGDAGAASRAAHGRAINDRERRPCGNLGPCACCCPDDDLRFREELLWHDRGSDRPPESEHHKLQHGALPKRSWATHAEWR